MSQPFYFFETIKHPCSTTWQVRRSDFDRMLLDNARARGVEVHQGAAVREVLMDGGRVAGVRAERAAGGSAAYHADAVIDASGRDAFLASRLGMKRRDPDLNKIAIFTYYRGALRDPGLDAGATTVAYIPDKGWFWYIPLPDDIVSVGVVAEKDYLYRDTRDPAEIFAREAAACIWIENHLRPGVRVEPVRVTGEFSYRAEAVGGDGFCLAGDAFSFLDPVFSTGLFMALKSGEMAADAVHRGLAEGGVTAATFEAVRPRHALGARPVPAARPVVLQRTVQLPRVHPGLSGPAPAPGRRARRQRLRRPGSPVRRTPRVLRTGRPNGRTATRRRYIGACTTEPMQAPQGAHGAPRRERRGAMGSPQAGRRGFGAQPRLE